jgi:hypothetical protein
VEQTRPSDPRRDDVQALLQRERRRAVRYGLAFGVVTAGIGSIAFGPDAQGTAERVAALGAMVAPVVTYASWLAASQRRMWLLHERGHDQVPQDVAERVQALLDAFDSEAAANGAASPFRLGRDDRGAAAAERFRATIAGPGGTVDQSWRTLRPARGTTRPA